MSIRKRIWGDDNEAWQVDLLIKGQRIRKQFPTQREAKAFELETRMKAKAGTYRADGSKITLLTVMQSFEDHLDKRHLRGQQMTLRHLLNEKAVLRNYLQGGVEFKRRAKVTIFHHGLAQMKVAEIHRIDIETFIDKLIESGLSLRTVGAIKSTLISVLDHAIRLKYIATNQARGIRILAPRNAKRKAQVVVPPKNLIKAMIQQCDGEFKIYFMLAVFTGVRAGEHRALLWRHIDFDRGTLTIDRRVDQRGDDDEQGAKTNAGNRTIPMSSDLIDALREWKKRVPFSEDSDLVFSTKNKTPLSHTNIIRGRYDPLFFAVRYQWPSGEKLPARPRWHDLRHFSVSCWIEAGLPPKAIQAFAGHKNLSTTMDTYGHLFPSVSHNAAMTAITGELLG